MALNPSISQLDAPQIQKRTFDESNDALRTVPAAATSFAIELDATDGDSVIQYPLFLDTTTILNAVPAQTNVNSSSQDMSNYRGFTVIISAVSLDSADATLKLQASVDNSVFVDLTGATVTLATGTSQAMLIQNNVSYKYFRAVYTHGTNTTGTVTAKYTAKS